MRAVVIGGGIVGLTTGIALRRSGIDVVVHEHAPEIRAAGAGLGLWANALAVFDELGIGDQVRAIGKPSEMYFHDPAGRLLETPEFGAKDHQYLLVHRAKLTDLLADAVGRDNIRLATGFGAYDEHDDHVTVRLTDGTSENADVLVGADGAYSAVRAQLVPGYPAQEHRGHHVWRAVIPTTGFTVPEDRVILGHNRCRGGYVRTYDGHVYWLLNQFDSPPLTGTRKQQALERVVHLQEDGQNSLLADLIAATPEEQILQNQIMLVPPLPHWVSARVVLAGDAAHAMSPHITAGATLGIEDAALLGRLLTPTGDVPAALAAYQATQIPRYAHVAQLSAAVEHAPTPQEFARHYAAFSHWMISPQPQHPERHAVRA
jgi:2-polyprenyl-6-methoxyphenol hydroxylase-like FAD-dependent oxidoreductase